MAKNNKEFQNSLRSGLITFSKVHFLLVLLLVGQTILYDASKLIAPETVLQRWIAISGLLAVNGLIWYMAKSKSGDVLLYKLMLLLMILVDIAFASFSVYTQRGMASKAVLLFIIPIVIAGLLRSRSALFATAILCIAVYSLTAVTYFVTYFNEGYKVELYGEVGFYSIIMLLVAGLLTKLSKSRA